MDKGMTDQSLEASKSARLRDVFYMYLGGIVVFAASVALSQYTTGWIGLIVYFVIGIYLTKVYLPQLITFHPVWNTIDNLVSIKSRAIFFWPIFYLSLLSKLGFLHAMK